MPFATRAPTNGGVKIGTSIATSERAGTTIFAAAASRLELRLARRQLAAALLASERGVEVAGLHAAHEGVHRVEALERVLAVEEPALVDLAQVDLDVVAG